jgi:hypothetical protein
MNSEQMEKVSFALDIDDGWPPVATESIWCKRIAGNYVLDNAPFFIKGLACGDEFAATPDSVNGCIFEFNIVKESGRSVVWAMNTAKLDIDPFIDALESLQCFVEGFPQFSLLSIDVPPTIDLSRFDALVSKWESDGLHFAYPTWRHQD